MSQLKEACEFSELGEPDEPAADRDIDRCHDYRWSRGVRRRFGAFGPKYLVDAFRNRPVTDSNKPFAVTHGIRPVADGIIASVGVQRRTGGVWAIMIDDAYTRDRRVRSGALATVAPTLAPEPPAGRRTPLLPERNGFWFPMLLFGALILSAPLVYRPSTLPVGIDPFWQRGSGQMPMPISGLAFAPLQQFGTCSEAFGDPMMVALYWFCVVMFGPLITLGWYHMRARRLGEVLQTGWFLLYALASLLLYVVLYPLIEFVTLTLPRGSTTRLGPTTQHMAVLVSVTGFVVGLAMAAIAVVPFRFGRQLSRARWTVGGLGLLLAIASAAAIELIAYLQPRNSYGALLIIGIGLLALSLVEPGRTCAVVAVVFTAVALVMNLIGLRMPDTPGNASMPHFSPVDMALTNLLLPAVILLTGGLIGLTRALLAHRNAR